MRVGVISRSWFALIVLTGSAVTVRGQQVPLFIFAGQSNMVGYATDSNQLTLDQQQLLSEQASRRQWAGQQSNPVSWTSMPAATQVNTPDPSGSDPRAFPISSGHGFGPELAAALTISQSQGNKTVGAVKVAVNSTGLRADGGDVDWSPSSGELYTDMVNRTNTAKTALANSQISAFFWMQGERDATDLDRADVYQANLVNMINTIRGGSPNGFGNSSLPIILGEIQGHPAFGQYTETIRRAQNNVARILPNVYIVRTDDLQHADNSVPFGDQHLSTQGTYDLGVRMAQAYLKSQNPVPIGPAAMNVAINGSFEDYAVSRWTGFGGAFGSGVPTSGTSMPGWAAVNKGATLTNIAVQNDWGGGTAIPSHGDQFLSLQNGAFNPGGTGGISQAMTTVNSGNASQRYYSVFFDYSAISRGGSEISGFTYDIGGAATPLSVDTTGMNEFQMVPWQSASFSFTATATTTTLRFLPTDTPDNLFFGASIDNVKVIQGFNWVGGSGNNWNAAANWAGGNPDGSDVIANFLWFGANKSSVSLNVGRSVKSLRFDSADPYTISGGNVLDLRSTSGNVSVIVARGNHIMNSRINFSDQSADVDIAVDSSLTMNGTFTNNNGSGRMLSKFGLGSLILGHANNTYAGPTRVIGGTLRLANNTTTNNISVSPNITVYRDGTLDTSGLSGGGLTLAANQDLTSGGTIRGGVNATASGVNVVPGNSFGTMAFKGSGNITLGANTVVDVEIGGGQDSTGLAGWAYDQIVIDGAGKTFFTGGARLNLIALAGRAHGDAYTIVSAVNGATINFTNVFKNLTGNLVNNVPATEGGLSYFVNYSSSSVTVTFTPEPSGVGMMLLGAVGLLRRRRD